MGFSVQLGDRDIGPGNGTQKAAHTLAPLLVLWYGDHLGNLPSCCPSPFDVPSYIELWLKTSANGSEVCQRARRNLKHGIRGAQGTVITADKLKRAIDHLQQAILCRRLDMWTWESANRAMAEYRASAEFVADNNGQPYHPNCKVANQASKIGSIIEINARSAFAQGGPVDGRTS